MLNPETAFRDVKKAGDGWMAKCPGHADGKSSLSIGLGDGGKILLKCFAGCDLDRILAAAHLKPADLFPEKPATTKATVTATYAYRDEGGQHLYDVCRFNPKDFRQRRADGVWKMDGVRRVLYHLDTLQGQTIAYVTEGEKDADRLRALGLPATCNVGGAGKWKAEYTAQLKAATVDHVVILPDNDDPGRQHAEDVARSCHAEGLKAKIVTLPDVPSKGDVSDWLAAGGSKDELIALAKATPIYGPPEPRAQPQARNGRTLQVTRAADIAPRPVLWLWAMRLAFGTLNLLGGREGIGKSIFTAWLTAMITRGRLPGTYEGQPRAVIIAATEDSWSHTLVPRLMGAGADLRLVFRVDVETADGADAALSLPRDLPALEALIAKEHVAALVLDPILSRLDAGLDSHKDGEVRQALEPLVSVLERTGCMGLGLIHVNKSTSNDPLTTLMASRAFAAVARAVLFVMVDPDNEQSRLIGQPKNNLGRADLPTLSFQIDGTKVADTAEGPVWTGQLRWTGESDRSIRDALEQATETQGGNRTAVSEAADWLEDYLASKDGSADSAEVKTAGLKAGHTKDAIHRARMRLKVTTLSIGFPRRTAWMLQSSDQSSDRGGETTTTHTTQTTEATDGQLSQSSESSELSEASPRAREEATTSMETPTGGSHHVEL